MLKYVHFTRNCWIYIRTHLTVWWQHSANISTSHSRETNVRLEFLINSICSLGFWLKTIRQLLYVGYDTRQMKASQLCHHQLCIFWWSTSSSGAVLSLRFDWCQTVTFICQCRKLNKEKIFKNAHTYPPTEIWGPGSKRGACSNKFHHL